MVSLVFKLHFICHLQGSESLASWQANLLFEPIEFEVIHVLISFLCDLFWWGEMCEGLLCSCFLELRFELVLVFNSGVFRELFCDLFIC